MKARIAIVEALPVYRAGILHTLAPFNAISIVAEGASHDDALRIARIHAPDIMVIGLDVGAFGPSLIASVLSLNASIRVVAISTSDARQAVSAAFHAGARGYLLRDVPCAEFIETLRIVAAGQVFLTPTIGARLLMQTSDIRQRQSRFSSINQLTAREKQVLAEVALGATNKAIATSLKVGERTVKYHMAMIMQKLGVRNRVEAVAALRAVSANVRAS